ncbi:MAG: hypothetical protein V4610_11380 [Pseudomonadota bacterium]|jgi:hypothetical protein|uniref:Uncharacterized protein n=1 Tax=hydrothermal vent metagenome TaxID=652676 RepID=A0A160TIE0_9ZZZZ
MTSATDAIRSVIAAGRGTRPASLDNVETEQVLTIALALLVELSVANDRIDLLEREVAGLRGTTPDALRNAPLPGDAIAERQEALEALQLRVLRVMVDPRAAAGG